MKSKSNVWLLCSLHVRAYMRTNKQKKQLVAVLVPFLSLQVHLLTGALLDLLMYFDDPFLLAVPCVECIVHSALGFLNAWRAS